LFGSGEDTAVFAGPAGFTGSGVPLFRGWRGNRFLRHLNKLFREEAHGYRRREFEKTHLRRDRRK